MYKKSCKFCVLFLLPLLLVVFLAGCGGNQTSPDSSAGTDTQEPPIEITLSIGAGHTAETMPYVELARDFFVPETTKRALEEANVKITWKEVYGGQVAKLAEVLEATESGLINVGLVAFPFEPAKLFLQNFTWYVPFSSPDATQVLRISRKIFDEFPILKDQFKDKYNQVFLGLGCTGCYDLATTFPWDKLADLKGHKLYAAGPNLPMLEGTGAIPVQSNITEAYTSFQTGVYDGVIFYPVSFYKAKLHEVCPYYTKVGFGATAVSAITVNLNTWNKLPEKVQTIFQEVALEYEAQIGELHKQHDAESLKKMEEEGAVISNFPQEERVKWANAMSNIPKARAEEADQQGLPGTEVMKAYLKYLQEDGFELVRDWEL